MDTDPTTPEPSTPEPSMERSIAPSTAPSTGALAALESELAALESELAALEAGDGGDG